MKAYGGRGKISYTPIILYFRYPLGRGLDGPQRPTGRCEEETHLSFPILLAQPLVYVL